MKALFLIQGQTQPASRYRVLMYLDGLRAAGIECEVRDYPRSIPAWIGVLRQRRTADVIFFQKKRAPRWPVERLKAGGARVIYDVDDAVMFASSRHESPDAPARMRRFESMCAASDAVTAGNRYLAGMAAQHCPRVVILPTSMDMRRYHPRGPARTAGRVVLGWIGGRKSLPFLRTLDPALALLRSRGVDVELKVVCNEFPADCPVPVVRKPWAEADEGADVASFDIGLAPLPDDPWSRGKCATKLLQCMAARVPCVASPVGAHEDIVAPGVNGFLAREPEEWAVAIGRLAADAAMRDRLGDAARETVARDYSLQTHGPRLAELLLSLRRAT
ncbi:MAG: glycosyltransferase family 4 protein [Candidatus Brocadiae bacterium]|nr:glycosyltransferase family 4 protein [Candidatus Brocadiia bacterium]